MHKMMITNGWKIHVREVHKNKQEKDKGSCTKINMNNYTRRVINQSSFQELIRLQTNKMKKYLPCPNI